MWSGLFGFKLMKVAYVGNFSQQHCTENHLALTLEDLGHQVTRLQENQTDAGSLVDLCRGHDLFLFTRTWGNLVTLDHLKQIEALGIPTASYHLDLYVGLKREDGLDHDPFWRTQYVFTPDGDPRSAEVFKRKVINHFYMKPGVYKAECNYGTYHPELAHDVTFVGGGLEYMHPEWPYRRKLVQWLMDNYSGKVGGYHSAVHEIDTPRFGKYGHPQRVMRNHDLNDLYASAKIAIGDSVCVPDFKHERYWSDRLYETVGRGGFIIHPYIKGLEEEFTLDGPDKNLVTYEYGNFDQLKELIDYYLTHDDESERIRKAGHEYVREHCTYHNRLQQMLETVFDSYALDDDRDYRESQESSLRAPCRINLGSGNDPLSGYINVDMLNRDDVDVVHNLMDFPYPFEDACANDIKAVDVLEHLDNYTADRRPAVIAFVEECHRILKTGGELYIQTPGYRAEFAWQDPTHVRPFHPKTFDLWDEDTEYGKTNGYYSHAKFKVRCEELENGNLRVWMVKR